jgi:hypothetical protein
MVSTVHFWAAVLPPQDDNSTVEELDCLSFSHSSEDAVVLVGH